jgi:hypothetical protein
MLGAGDLEVLGEITVVAVNDLNDNGMADATDTLVEGVTFILVPPGIKQTTGENGETVFTGLRSGVYAIAVIVGKEMPKDEHDYFSMSYSDDNESKIIHLIEGEHAEIVFVIQKNYI